MAKRRQIAVAAETTCPRCGSSRARDQAYCVECGLRLPVVAGTVAALRRRWVRRIGWYPGDWVWLALASFVLAAAGAAAAIELGRRHAAASPSTYVVPAPKAPLVGSPSGRNGHTQWPRGLDGWTVVLDSWPSTRGRAKPLKLATGAARRGLPQVGVLDSSAFASLHPGYFVVFSGVYGAAGDARVALETVRTHGFGGAYVLRVAA
jgi:hypothetical protein